MKKIKIKVNGKVKTVLNNSKLSDLLKNLNIPLKKVAIELNQEIIDKKRYLLIFKKPKCHFFVNAI